MAAADQIKGLIRSFAEGDEAGFYATAMQIAASEARSGHLVLANELKKLIDKAKSTKSSRLGIVKPFPISASQKELNDLLELIQPHERLQEMILESKVQKSLRRVLDEQHKVELLRKNNLSPRKKLLFVGPPGCGKTMSARVLATELGLPLFIIRLDGLISRYMGESIAKLRLIFDAMNQFRAVYFFDEFDSIGTTRNQPNDVGEIKRVLNTFLLQIEKDNSNSLVIAATNFPESLDQALFRRFDDIIQFPLPDLQEIIALYQKELADFKLSDTFNIQKIAAASVGLSYSDVHRVCKDIVKDFLVYGPDEVSEERLIIYAQQRRHPF
ncbi:AAA family ATPase [Chitinophaga rhizophila]|uniref:ATP-binding protein n=1 Tax=Chitinophaga rhizophila TaxID=2866212 RepID=A0ABS7GLN1_9BACT|nr:ATP-binding protein [Chitinophaga rhizophila]MBW8688170.1 ATP-binding protein [Chitinophaga rhizophila]